ncbi:MAG: toxin, partial [Gammaproteobacteria bacterium]
HIPLTIAGHLSKNQRFAEAQRWFHYIFEPTSNDQSDEPKRFWKFLAFRNPEDRKRIEDIVEILSIPRSALSPDDQKEQDTQWNDYKTILNNPFQPHAVARTRHLAYQYCVVMKYLDNLIAWGDHLFQQDTVESINEAMQLYVSAANILGERPQRITPRGTVKATTFADLKKKGLGPIGDPFVDLQSQFPFSSLGTNSGTGADGKESNALFGIGRTLYFCIPPNEKLLGYWDTVADRLFKIRHCMNIAGVVRPLALFDPPIDPGMLVKATAAGIDIGSIVNGLNQPVGPVRCLFRIQKALELCGEVRNMGAALLSAIEKGDNERLALLRQGHEIKIQEMAKEVRFLQWKQAQESTEALLRGRDNALERYSYYLRLLGQTSADNTNLELSSSTPPEITEENFNQTYTDLVGQYDKMIAIQTYPTLKLAAADTPLNLADLIPHGSLFLSEKEFLALNVLPLISTSLRIGSAAADIVFSTLATLPHVNAKVAPYGVGSEIEYPLGEMFANVGKAVSSSIGTLATLADAATSLVGLTATYERRTDEWMLQANLAARELMQIGRQIIGSLIAEQIVHHEYQNIQKQIDHSREVDQFLREKFSNEELYAWMQGEITRLYYEYYRFAFDTARKAEQTMKQELMRPEVNETDYIKFNYWDGGRKGLLSGEALYLDIKRMEMAYHENNKRELELTKHISLRQLNPVALLTFKATGSCQVTIPEWVYDLDCPGHYMRRIKNVALSIPSVVGPYTSINCTLSLLKSSLRKSPLTMGGEYVRKGSEDERFVDYIGAVQSIVTSSGQNDAGMFETSLRDERFLPFEGAGAESTWKLDLPMDYPPFDYATISDVILHIRYTARQGVEPTKVKAALVDLLQQTTQSNLALVFNLRHDFPSEWSAFVNGAGDFNATIRKDYFPYFAQGKTISITGLELYEGLHVSNHHPVGNQSVWDAYTDDLGDNQAFAITAAEDSGPAPVLTRAMSEQVFLIVRYTLAP